MSPPHTRTFSGTLGLSYLFRGFALSRFALSLTLLTLLRYALIALVPACAYSDILSPRSNKCVQLGQDYPYHCGAGPAPFYNKTHHVDVHSNTFYYPNATAEPGWSGACGCWPNPKIAGACPFKTFADWQAHGHDAGSTVDLTFSNKAILAQARTQLGMQGDKGEEGLMGVAK
jgi:hypothetical protein